MDLFVVLLLVLALGLRQVRYAGNAAPRTPSVAEDGSIRIADSARPVGNNLALKRNPEAFLFIVRQLGLWR